MARTHNRNYWRNQAERLLATNMPVREWSILNDVKFESMYRWLGIFADEEPDLFGGKECIASRSTPHWVQVTRDNMARAQAIVRHEDAGFLIIDTPSLRQEPVVQKDDSSSDVITITSGPLTISIPAGCAPDDISNVLTAVSRL